MDPRRPGAGAGSGWTHTERLCQAQVSAPPSSPTRRPEPLEEEAEQEGSSDSDRRWRQCLMQQGRRPRPRSLCHAGLGLSSSATHCDSLSAAPGAAMVTISYSPAQSRVVEELNQGSLGCGRTWGRVVAPPPEDCEQASLLPQGSFGSECTAPGPGVALSWLCLETRAASDLLYNNIS